MRGWNIARYVNAKWEKLPQGGNGWEAMEM
jgi:hypothetical protein